MCTARAGHTATELDDGNILLFGGEFAGQSEPVPAEAFLLSALGSVPVSSDPALFARRGHTATRLDCPVSPCPLFIAGGVGLLGEARNPLLLALSDEQPAGGYSVAATELVQLLPRLGHASAPLPDGTVFVLGGTDTSGAPMRQAALWSPCTDQTDLAFARGLRTTVTWSAGAAR